MKRLTHANAAPVIDNLNVQTIAPGGRALLQDVLHSYHRDGALRVDGNSGGAAAYSPGALFRLMDEGERERLFANTARALGDADCDLKQRHGANCSRAHPAYGAGVARALGLGEVS